LYVLLFHLQILSVYLHTSKFFYAVCIFAHILSLFSTVFLICYYDYYQQEFFFLYGDIGNGNVLVRSGGGGEKEDDQVTIELEEPVELTFVLRYLNFFTKATALGPTVVHSLSPDVPIIVEYPIEDSGDIKYYLAPKIDEGE
jgi:proliferating cell nuclear antigen PCNA